MPNMKFKFTLYAVMSLAGWLTVPDLIGADQKPSKDETKRETIDVQRQLEKGAATGSLPDGMVIRIGACLGESNLRTAVDNVPDELRETWEFTSNQVHRVEIEYNKDKSTYKRVESRPFDSKNICKDLIEGKAIEIQARKGKGPEVAFVGTHYHRGSRNIEVEWNGETILDLGETNGAELQVYRESDARAFGALYERLASQAHAMFKPNAVEAK